MMVGAKKNVSDQLEYSERRKAHYLSESGQCLKGREKNPLKKSRCNSQRIRREPVRDVKEEQGGHSVK